MCGIAGIVKIEASSKAWMNLERVLQAQFVRGPDDGQTYIDQNITLGHRRLKIFDLSNLGLQPMVDSELGLALVFNGAIYNFVSLRNELQAMGYSFRSSGDTEVLLKAYHAWGKGCLLRLQGMFAFAIWEQNTGKLILARDRMGIKPLYYTADSFKDFRFASTLPALLKFGDVNTQVDKTALHYYLMFHAVPEPYTILAGVRKLPAATIMTVHPDGRKEEEVYWDLFINDEKAEQGYDESYWIDKTHNVLSSAIQRQLAADVPVEILLSGGLDSSLLVAMASQFQKCDIDTFSIGFENSTTQEGNEFYYSNLISSKYHTRHHQYFISNDQQNSSLEKCIAAMSEPMLSHDNIGFYLLSKEVAKQVKVVLSGQGADELFAGYNWFRTISSYPSSPIQSAQLILDQIADRSYNEYKELVSFEYQTPFYAFSFLNQLAQKNGSANPVDNLIKYESTFALANGPLSRVDNMSMASSIEARVPFLDEEVLSFASTLPLHYKLPQGGKYILKKVGEKLLPKQIIDRPKGYFPVPALKHLSGSTLELMREVLSDENLKKRGIFNPQSVKQLFDSSDNNYTPTGSSKLWQVGLLEYWLQQHV